MLGQGRQRQQPYERGLMECSHIPIEVARFTGHLNADISQFVRCVERLHEAYESLDQAVRTAGTAQQIINIVQALSQIILFASRCTSGLLYNASSYETGELSAARTRPKPSPVRDLLCGGRLPQIGEREIDASLLCREQFEMAFEIFRVVIDQIEQIGHQVAKGATRSETGHDHNEAGVATGQDLQRPNCLGPSIVARHRLPQHGALLWVEWAQLKHPEQVVQGLVRVVDLVEPASRTRNQDDPGLGLENLAQPPSCILVGHVPEHHVQVLDQQHEPLALTIREIEQGSKATVLQHPVVANSAQFVIGAMQVRAAFPVWRLDGETRQTFQPELPLRGNLVALFRENNRKKLADSTSSRGTSAATRRSRLVFPLPRGPITS